MVTPLFGTSLFSKSKFAEGLSVIIILPDYELGSKFVEFRVINSLNYDFKTLNSETTVYSLPVDSELSDYRLISVGDVQLILATTVRAADL